VRAAASAWDRFWFAPQPTSTLALVRIAFGLLVLAWALALLPVAGPLFEPGGAQPAPPSYEPGLWGVLNAWNSDGVAIGLLAALIAAAAAVTVGALTRVATVVVFVALISLHARNPFVLNSGDTLLRGTAFFLMLAPAGASFSVDAALRRGRGALSEFPARAPWALRLMQVQLSVLYLSSAWSKVRGTTWNDGTALGYALGLDDLRRFPLPHFLLDSAGIMNALTWGTLVVEVSLGVLIWNRALRPYVIAAGLALHLGIDYSLRVGFFGLAIVVSYIAFVPPETASRLLARVARAKDVRVRTRRAGARTRAPAGSS
jgi:hypothetical protein